MAKNTNKQGGQVHSFGNLSVVDTKVGTYAMRMSSYDNPEMEQFFSMSTSSWDSDPVSVAGFRVVPWGLQDNLPTLVRNLLEKNNLAPGILLRKAGLIYGQGPALYRNQIADNEINRQWVEDSEIQSWLESWDYRRYIRDAIVEYNHMGGVFVKYRMGRGVRIGRPWVASLEALASKDCKLLWPESGFRNLDSVKGIIVGDFENYRQSEVYKYPVFDRFNPTASEIAVKYHALRSFGRNFYAVSSFLGSLPWMENANELPQIIAALNRNMMAGAYIIHEPAGYWAEKRNQILEMEPQLSLDKVQAKLDDLRDQLIKQISEVMSGSRNAGKFITAIDTVDPVTEKEQSFKIEPIEMNIDKYIDAQVKISRIADSSTTSGLGLNPALANIIIDGKGDSGSQMLYALKIFFGADTQIPEDIVLEAVNDAIAINFPKKKGIRIGLYRQMINKEDNVPADSRTTNNV